MFPRYLTRQDSYPYDVEPFGEQPYYVPDPSTGRFWGMLDKGASLPPPGFPEETAATGTSIFPYVGTGPRQYARPFIYYYNSTHNATFYEWCMSVKGQPTRGTVLDGKAGRVNYDIFIPQPRRQAPGWDGCRDRDDNRTDLPNMLLWSHPAGRSMHRVVYSEDYDIMLLYGGLGYDRPQVPTKSLTYPVSPLADMWQYDFNRCPSNCSNHGTCRYGFCYCDQGYYGLDCSNSSCPGDFCYYDTITNIQHCVHCCSAGYQHHDNETWVENARKVPCSRSESGESNGVCDGFGTCQCTPPFVGDDCSIKDCPNNCSFNGWCSVEYPVSRCMCNPGYYGDSCQYLTCLNNCTYPNGICDITTGLCKCELMYNPYNNTRWYSPFYGEDCSYVVAFAGAHTIFTSRSLFITVTSMLTLTAWLTFTSRL